MGQTYYETSVADVQTLMELNPLFAAQLEIVTLRRQLAEMVEACKAHEKHDYSSCSDTCHCGDAGKCDEAGA